MFKKKRIRNYIKVHPTKKIRQPLYLESYKPIRIPIKNILFYDYGFTDEYLHIAFRTNFGNRGRMIFTEKDGVAIRVAMRESYDELKQQLMKVKIDETARAHFFSNVKVNTAK